jgi:hypothetical protein
MTNRLLNKPLKDHLAGLLRKIDGRNYKGKAAQSIIDSIVNILNECSHLDNEVYQ